MRAGRGISISLTPWRRDAIRTTLWVVPAALLPVSVGLFAFTNHVDHLIYSRAWTVPSWVRIESPDGCAVLAVPPPPLARDLKKLQGRRRQRVA